MCRNLYIVCVEGQASHLFTIDPATASTNHVGSVGIASVTDIAFHGPTLYGVSFSQFLRLNPRTGAGVTVGPIGFSTVGLAVASDGVIYASGGGQLISIDPVTGTGTLVGNFGSNLTSSGDLAFDSNDILYGAMSSGGGPVLARINRVTGVATTIGPFTIGTVWGLAFFCCRLYGVTAGAQLVNINVKTGNATVIGDINVSGGAPLSPWGMTARLCCSGC
jgi:hypothetical protein